MVKVRFAPSPTGALHVGGVRTAIYNYLFAKNQKGEFYLRIEDTDPERSREDWIKIIIDGLSWIGVKWDGEIIYQSKRLEIYKEYAFKLLKEGKAYYCFCTEEELERYKEEAKILKKPFKYPRTCLKRTKEEIEKLEKEGRKKAIRFKIPEGKTKFFDLIHGEIEFDNSEIEDFVILRPDLSPTYQLACVVDDHFMGITHVIRGDDHISNTPKQILLYKSFGWEIPQFAHLPMILGPDKKRLSKRHGATSITEFREGGFLPEAIFNFLALLGWSPGDNREIISKEEMIETFDIKRVNKRGCIFDINKLLWMNSEYIKNSPDEKILNESLVFFEKKEWFEKEKHMEILKKIIPLFKTRIRILKEFPEFADYFFTREYNYEKEGIDKYFIYPEVFEIIEEVLSEINILNEFNKENLEKIVREKAKENNVKTAFIIHPLRILLTGKQVGPGLFEIMEILGKEEVIFRIKRGLEELRGFIPYKTSYPERTKF
ncbi:MAG: glutamate--tRNA ligase [candidate division WOR-3 bacterium]